MSFRIKGEKDGLLHEAGVDQRKRLITFATTEPEDKFKNKLLGTVWSTLSSTTAVGAGDYIYYLKNTGTDTYTVTDIRVFAGAATTLYIDVVSGTPTFAAGVDLTPVSRNLGKNATMTATIKEDTDTTGLTNEGTLFFIRCDTANEMEHLRTSSNIVVPQGTAFAIRTSVATQVDMIVSLSKVDL